MVPPVSSPSEAPVVRLPAARPDGQVPVERALAGRRSVRDFRGDPLRLADAAQILWACQGETGPEGQRTAPSAGALYPLVVDLVAARVEGLPPGVYRYLPHEHALRRRADGDARRGIVAAAHGQSWIEGAPAIVVLSGIYRVTAARYGDRAPRYVHLEAGHAAENLHLQAEALGLGAVVVGAFDDAGVQRALGLAAEEEPLVLMPVGRQR